MCLKKKKKVYQYSFSVLLILPTKHIRAVFFLPFFQPSTVCKFQMTWDDRGACSVHIKLWANVISKLGNYSPELIRHCCELKLSSRSVEGWGERLGQWIMFLVKCWPCLTRILPLEIKEVLIKRDYQKIRGRNFVASSSVFWASASWWAETLLR